MPWYLEKRKSQLYKELSNNPDAVIAAVNAMAKASKDIICGSVGPGSKQVVAQVEVDEETAAFKRKNMTRNSTSFLLFLGILSYVPSLVWQKNLL